MSWFGEHLVSLLLLSPLCDLLYSVFVLVFRGMLYGRRCVFDPIADFSGETMSALFFGHDTVFLSGPIAD